MGFERYISRFETIDFTSAPTIIKSLKYQSLILYNISLVIFLVESVPKCFENVSKSIIYLISRLIFTKIYTVLEIVVYDILAKSELNRKNRLGVTTKRSIFTYTLLTHYLHSPTHTIFTHVTIFTHPHILTNLAVCQHITA